jgi:uncharacterized protein (TIGR00369 family)
MAGAGVRVRSTSGLHHESREITMSDTPFGSKTYGILPLAQQLEFTGFQFVQGLADGSVPLNTMAGAMSYDIASAAEGRVLVTGTPRSEYLNPAGTVHGGWAATLLDSCMGLAIRTLLPAGVASTTLEFKVTFVRPVTIDSGPVHAEGSVLHSGRSAGMAEGRLVDSKGRLLAHATTTCLNLHS